MMIEKWDSKTILVLVAIILSLMAITAIVTNHLSDMVSDYEEVNYDYTVEYNWNNTCPYYEITFDAKYDGYLIMDIGTSIGYRTTDMMYHKGHNHILIPTDCVIAKPHHITFYERR